MKSDLNKKIELIYDNFKKELQKAKDNKDIQVAQLLERVEKKYVEELKKNINL